MNVFDVLYTGKRRITEENVSAVLAWMLDPRGSHGWGAEFLRRLLDSWPEKKTFKEWKRKLPVGPGYGTESTATADVRLEYPVTPDGGDHFRFIDVLVSLSTGDGGAVTIILENKIRSGSVGQHQLLEEYAGLVADLEQSGSKSGIALLYVVPAMSPRVDAEIKELPQELPKHVLTWSGEEHSMESILRSLLQDDADVKIGPLSTEVVALLKSFLMHVARGFSREPIGTERRASEYFTDYVAGIDGLAELADRRSDVFVGFEGGIDALRKRADENREELERRPFKWSEDDSSGNKRRKNWIPIGQVIQALGLSE